MARPVVQRLKRLKAAQLFKSYVWTPYRLRNVPLLSVVVPFHDSVRQLPRTLESLLAQHDQKLEVILVDDGSTDGSREVADRYAKAHRNIRVVEQAHAGVGAARNTGVQHAEGEYLAFCDSDDRVVPGGYARLVRVLRWTGSDLAVGSVAVQVKGKYQTPAWAHRSNARRQVAVTPDEVPEIFGNLMLGARVFRRSAWDEKGWRFTRDDERSDPSLVVTTLLGGGTVDVLPSVVYRWSFRED